MTLHLYGFTGESMIPKGIIKLAVTLEEAHQMMTIMIDFLVVNRSSAFNRVLGKPLLKVLKAAMSIHCLRMKFPTMVGIVQVQGRHWDSRECYNLSLELAETKKELPQKMEVERTNKGPMETNVDLHLQEDVSTTRPIKELVEVQVDPNEPNHVIKISKELNKELA